MRARQTWLLPIGLVVGLTGGAAPVLARDVADTAADAVDGDTDIVVFGRQEAKIGTAQSASEGSVAGADLPVRPLQRMATLIETVPGVIAAQHSGSGKANQYFLRGFNLDHGTDFSVHYDGVPMNLRSHGHGQGYLDLNGLIPETVERIDFRKGPYRADGGDFSLAGAAYLSTVRGYDAPWVSAEAGGFGHRRLAAGGTWRPDETGALTLVGEAKTYDGPWQQPERLSHVAALVKYVQPTSIGELLLSVQGYRGDWRPTEQIPERIIGTPLCPDVYCSPDLTATGSTRRLIATLAVRGTTGHVTAHARVIDWQMYSNPEYFTEEGTSAQIRQVDRRAVYGLSAEKRWPLSDGVELVLGTDNRLDAIARVGVARTAGRRFVESFGTYRVSERSAALYGALTIRPDPGLRITGGLRGDHYAYRVRALDQAAAATGTGSGSDAILSPKLQLAYRAADGIELYADWGRGFHSNDVRGAVTQTPVPVLVAGTGAELGVRFGGAAWNVTLTRWWLDLDSELRFVGDSNAVEPSAASHRRGYEATAFWRPLAWLALDGNVSINRARYENGDFVPNAFESSVSAGVSLIAPGWEAGLRVRHLGPYPLIEDNSVRDRGSTVVSVRASHTIGRFDLYAEIANLLNSRDKDIAYFYTAYLPPVDVAPVDGRLSRIIEPRSLRAGVKIRL